MIRFLRIFYTAWHQALELHRQKPKDEKPDKEKDYEYFRINSLVGDPEASRELHRFLLKIASGGPDSKPIPVCQNDWTVANFEIGVISIDQAPLIPPKKQ